MKKISFRKNRLTRRVKIGGVVFLLVDEVITI